MSEGSLVKLEIACAAVGNACMTVAMTGIACLPVLIFIRMNVGA